MTYTIAQTCIGTKDLSCIAVCPVDCIHPTTSDAGYDEAEQLYIDPDECIDCGACVPECPVEAIFPEEEVPADQTDFTPKNADYFKLSGEEFKGKWGSAGRPA